jgi:hypothetical protein
MGLKTYALRLDEEVYESLKKALQEYGDPDLSISFIVRKYLRDLNDALPYLKKSELSLMNNLSYWGMALKQMGRLADFELLMKGKIGVNEEGKKIKGRRKV